MRRYFLFLQHWQHSLQERSITWDSFIPCWILSAIKMTLISSLCFMWWAVSSFYILISQQLCITHLKILCFKYHIVMYDNYCLRELFLIFLSDNSMIFLNNRTVKIAHIFIWLTMNHYCMIKRTNFYQTRICKHS